MLVDLQPLAPMSRARQPRPQRALQRAVFNDPGELGRARLVRVEHKLRTRVVAVDAHRMHRHQALGGQRRPDAERAQELHIARAERIDARIETLERGQLRCSADERDRRTAQRAHQACADRAAADDDEIAAAAVYNVGP
jgi:hypothetical protein